MMLEVSSLRSPPTPCPPSPSCSSKVAAAATDPPHQLVGFVGDHAAGIPTDDGFMDDTDSLLLDYIDFSSCDVVVPFFDADGDVLPDLEADPTELLAEFSLSPPDDDDDDPTVAVSPPAADDECCRSRCLLGDNDEAKRPPAADLQDPDPDVNKQDLQQPMEVVAVEDKKAEDEEKRWLLAATAHDKSRTEKQKKDKEGEDGSSAVTTSNHNQDHQEEDYSAAGAGGGANASKSSSSAAAEGHHHTHSHSKKKPPPASNAKRKVKVDWTPELHRRFVQAVEQLGIDKAVPSRILEIMGIECLTRHNIASHLQKYRSHRKHLMAREAEAASWAQKRQMYAGGGGGTAAPMMRNSKQQLDVPSPAAAAGPRPWVVPTIGFPPPPAPFCRPLHVWGHPPTTSTGAVEAAAAPPPGPTMLLPLPVWPRHGHLAPPPRQTWAVDPAAYWHQQYSAARKWGPPQPAAVTQGTPVPVPPPMPMQLPRFPVPGMVPHPVPTMYNRPAMAPPPPPPPPPRPTSKLAELQLQLDAHPSKESIDAAIGDVLVKPWLPLPLGLKPPSLDSVMSELHKHGIPKVPPAAREP